MNSGKNFKISYLFIFEKSLYWWIYKRDEKIFHSFFAQLIFKVKKRSRNIKNSKELKLCSMECYCPRNPLEQKSQILIKKSIRRIFYDSFLFLCWIEWILVLASANISIILWFYFGLQVYFVVWKFNLWSDENFVGSEWLEWISKVSDFYEGIFLLTAWIFSTGTLDLAGLKRNAQVSD